MPSTGPFPVYVRRAVLKANMANKLSELDMGAFIIRIGFWGPLYYNHSKEPPKKLIQALLRRPYSMPTSCQSSALYVLRFGFLRLQSE